MVLCTLWRIKPNECDGIFGNDSPHCGKVRHSKGSHYTVFRTVFGEVPVESPRLNHCSCQTHDTESFRPLAELLPEQVGTFFPTLRDDTVRDLERIKWFLWHGNVFRGLNELRSVESELESAAIESENDTAWKLHKAVREFSTFIARNQAFIPNYGERYRNGEHISTGFVESTVNYVVSKRMVKKQQMKWSQRGAHLLLQIRTRVLNGQWEDAFRRW